MFACELEDWRRKNGLSYIDISLLLDLGDVKKAEELCLGLRPITASQACSLSRISQGKVSILDLYKKRILLLRRQSLFWKINVERKKSSISSSDFRISNSQR